MTVKRRDMNGMSTVRKSIPRVSPQGRKYVEQVLDFGFHNASSPGISARLEREFAERFGVRYGIGHSNGTTTMHSALLAAGVGVGDEVIVPAVTAAATATVAVYVNAVPIFADIDDRTFTIDIDDIRRKITKRTKAIIPVSLYGLTADMDPIMEMAKEHDLVVIEDNAQCFLGYYKGRIAGSIGDMASFSFQSSKHITCGDGGILITDNEELAARVRQAGAFGYTGLSAKPGDVVVPEEIRCSPSFARHQSIGHNFRLPEIAAAAVLGELERIEEVIEMRCLCARMFEAVVKDCDWIAAQYTPEGYVNSYWTYACVLAEGGPGFAEFRKKFIELGGDGLYSAWLPLYKEPAFTRLSEMVQKNPGRWPHYVDVLPDYREVTCANIESIQPRMIQLKTNYFDTDIAEREAEILAETIRFFG